jgi:hypothetical protein
MVAIFTVMGVGENGVVGWRSNANLKIVLLCARGLATHRNAIKSAGQFAISQFAQLAAKASIQTVAR